MLDRNNYVFIRRDRERERERESDHIIAVNYVLYNMYIV